LSEARKNNQAKFENIYKLPTAEGRIFAKKAEISIDERRIKQSMKIFLRAKRENETAEGRILQREINCRRQIKLEPPSRIPS
jgi:hypothetical protein